MIYESNELGKLIRDIRYSANITAEELGDIAGISPTNITRFETGKIKNPSFETVYRLLRAIANLDIIKNGDFVLSNYDHSIVNLLIPFIQSEQTERQYMLNIASEKLDTIANNIEYINSNDVDFINFYIKSKKHIAIASRCAINLKNTINNLNKAEKVNGVDDFKYFTYLQHLLSSEHGSDADKDILDHLFSSALNSPNEDNLFNLFSYWLEYMSKMLPLLVDDLETKDGSNKGL